MDADYDEDPVVEQDDLPRDLIARRAYEIHVSGDGETELDDWLRAERELRAERGAEVTA